MKIRHAPTPFSVLAACLALGSIQAVAADPPPSNGTEAAPGARRVTSACTPGPASAACAPAERAGKDHRVAHSHKIASAASPLLPAPPPPAATRAPEDARAALARERIKRCRLNPGTCVKDSTASQAPAREPPPTDR
jgi:hypothetical protein